MYFTPNLLFLFWNIGKLVYEGQCSSSNIIEKYSNYYSYYYGNSSLFTRENIHMMKRFYMNFPIYYPKLSDFSWDQYQLLLKIPNKEERLFYFHLSLFFQSDIQETNDFIQNNYFCRI